MSELRDEYSKPFEGLLLISALLLSFAIACFQSVTHDDLFEADERYLSYYAGAAGEPLFSISLWFQQRAYTALGAFFGVFVTSATAHGCLLVLVSKQVLETLSHHQGFNLFVKTLLLLQYIVLVFGVGYLLDTTHSLNDIKIPLYIDREFCVKDGDTNSNYSMCTFDRSTYKLSEGKNCTLKYGPEACVPQNHIVHMKSAFFYWNSVRAVVFSGLGGVLFMFCSLSLWAYFNTKAKETAVHVFRDSILQKYTSIEVKEEFLSALDVDILVTSFGMSPADAAQFRYAKMFLQHAK